MKTILSTASENTVWVLFGGGRGLLAFMSFQWSFPISEASSLPCIGNYRWKFLRQWVEEAGKGNQHSSNRRNWFSAATLLWRTAVGKLITPSEWKHGSWLALTVEPAASDLALCQLQWFSDDSSRNCTPWNGSFSDSLGASGCLWPHLA